jgi:hypothetical protein
MEKVGPIPPPHALLAAGKIIPLGQGWVLEPMETGFLLKALAIGASVRVTTEEAQAVRQGEVPPETLAARHGMALPQMPPGAAITVAFSDEALRLAGRGRGDGDAGGRSGDQPARAGQAGVTLPRMAIIGVAVVALLILALIWAG